MEQRQRLDAMQKLRSFQVRVLVSTDLTARGVDIERITLVINLDLPLNPETYIHRVGRTVSCPLCFTVPTRPLGSHTSSAARVAVPQGRFGTHGVSITFVHAREEGRLQSFAKVRAGVQSLLPISVLTARGSGRDCRR